MIARNDRRRGIAAKVVENDYENGCFGVTFKMDTTKIRVIETSGEGVLNAIVYE